MKKEVTYTVEQEETVVISVCDSCGREQDPQGETYVPASLVHDYETKGMGGYLSGWVMKNRPDHLLMLCSECNSDFDSNPVPADVMRVEEWKETNPHSFDSVKRRVYRELMAEYRWKSRVGTLYFLSCFVALYFLFTTPLPTVLQAWLILMFFLQTGLSFYYTYEYASSIPRLRKEWPNIVRRRR